MTGRLGQSLVNPLFPELRAERRSLVMLLDALGLTAEADPVAEPAPVLPLRVAR